MRERKAKDVGRGDAKQKTKGGKRKENNEDNSQGHAHVKSMGTRLHMRANVRTHMRTYAHYGTMHFAA